MTEVTKFVQSKLTNKKGKMKFNQGYQNSTYTQMRTAKICSNSTRNLTIIVETSEDDLN